jgi:hypothetical protein
MQREFPLFGPPQTMERYYDDVFGSYIDQIFLTMGHFPCSRQTSAVLQSKGSPNGFEMRRESGEQGRICDGCDLGGIVGCDLIFDLCDSFERLFPTLFEFAAHQAIGRSAASVLKCTTSVLDDAQAL